MKQIFCYVYILECSDQSYYIGVTNDLERRLEEHNVGIDRRCFTYRRRPVKLIYFEEYGEMTQAIAREKQLKGWSRAKKKALMDKNWRKLTELSLAYWVKRAGAPR